jgi:hypothetical protein
MYGYGYFNTFKNVVGGIPSPSQIFGANLYDWWDFTDDSTLTKSGTRVDAITSKASARQFTSSGANRPQVVTGAVNGLQVANFDGVSEFMQVPSSTALYNFLHNQEDGGMVIIISKLTDADPNNLQYILNNTATTSNVGSAINYDDRLSVPANNVIRSLGVRGVGGTTSYNNVTSNNFFTTQQFNILRSIVDPNNGTAANRSKLSINFGADIQNNISISAPSTSNATNNLTLGRLADSSSFFLKGDFAEVLITTGQPTSEQLTQIQTYLTSKYGTFPIT